MWWTFSDFQLWCGKQSQKGQTGQKVLVSSGKLLFKEEQVLNLCCDVLGTWGQNINHITTHRAKETQQNKTSI